MQELSTRKRMAVVRLYLEGFSHNQIVARAGVSKGAVANLVAELKAGRFPETAEVSGQVQMLRELAVDLQKSRLTPAQALAGIAVLSRLQALGIEPSQVERWAEVCRQLAPQGSEASAFVSAALALEEVRERTGLAPEALEKKVRGLDEKAARLGQTVQQLEESQGKLRDLEKRRQALEDAVAQLEKRHQPLSRSVPEKERREAELAHRVQELETRAQAADERLASARKDLQSLAGLGLPPEGLTGFMQRLSGIAHRHGIQPGDLQERLLRELEVMDEALGLEALLNKRKQELTAEQQALTKARQERTALEAANQQLVQQQAALHVAIGEEQKQLRTEIRAISKVARDTVVGLKQDLKVGTSQALLEVQELKRQTLAVGKELGRLEHIVESNQWLETLLALMNGGDGVSAASVRVITLGMLRGVAGWLDRNATKTSLPTFLKTRVRNTIEELEGWQL